MGDTALARKIHTFRGRTVEATLMTMFPVLACIALVIVHVHSYNPASPVRRANGLYLNEQSVLGDVTNLPINEFDNFNREVPALSR